MAGDLARRYADAIAARSTLVVVGFLVLTAAVAAGAVVTETEDAGIGQFEVDSPETEAADEIEATYGEDDQLVSQLVVRDREGDVLMKESLVAGLEYQQAIRDDDAVAETLAAPGLVGIENLVGTVAALEDRGSQPSTGPESEAGGQPTQGELPTLDEQQAALSDRSPEEVEALLARVLDPDATLPGDVDPYELLPTSYEPGSTEAESRLTLVFQADETGPNEDPRAAFDAQVTMNEQTDDFFADAFVFGQGVNDDASNRAVGDSFAVITPVALLFVLLVLGIAYRDILDILLAIVGIVAVLAWLSGIMGWLSIPSSQLLIAVPFLLIGLSIDYALHVVMRYREARNDEGGESLDVRRGMAAGLAGVVLALAAATFSTAIGFLSNVASPLPAIRDFAILSASGIVATFLVFGLFVPALKMTVDGFVENRLGRSRRKRAFGVGGGPVSGLLSGLAGLSGRVPVAVLLVAALLATGGAVGATDIDTEFNQADFLPESPPGWAEYLPGGLDPGTYTIAEDFEYLSQNFQLGGNDRAEILIRGNVTDPGLLTGAAEARQTRRDALATRPDSQVAVDGPDTVLREVAADNQTVAAAVDRNDRDGDGLPDENVTAVYDLLFTADEEAASEVLYREDGEYRSARLLVGVRGDASSQAVARDARGLASDVQGSAAVQATATGGPVTTAVIQDALLETLVQAFAVTLVVILLFLILLSWRRHGAPTLGVVTLLPVLVALCWLLGAMALFGIPFNSETAVITSLAIGLGVDYSIHATERFVEEREHSDSLPGAMEATITGTGGALLASAATTAGGFGVLGFALAPPIRRFGLVTGVSIVFALVACLTVLPCLLVLRERLLDRRGSDT